MSFLKKLFKSNAQENHLPEYAPDSPEHAVIVYFDNYGSTDLTRLFEVEDRLEKAIENAGVGEYDGNEICVDGTDGTLWMYGPDADALFETIKPILFEIDWFKESKILLRYGPPEDGVRERRIKLGG